MKIISICIIIIVMNIEKENEEFIRKYVRKDTRAYRFWRTLCILPAYLLYRPKYKGKENIPDKGGVILASNHIHLGDPAFVLLSTDRVVRYMAKKELHDSPLGFMYRSANTIPVDRQYGAHDSLMAAEIHSRPFGSLPKLEGNEPSQALQAVRFRKHLPRPIASAVSEVRVMYASVA